MRISGLLVFTLLSAVLFGGDGSPAYFVPTHRVAGIGAARDDLAPDLIESRAQRMIESQTFSILRDPLSVPGAKRITSDPKLQKIFRSAAASSGLPVTLIEAVAYLESWGEARAESPSGPKGIMQVSEGTARMMGLKVVEGTRYKVFKEKIQLVRRGRKPAYKTISHRVPYRVTVRDDRLTPARAIPAAANYLASMEQKFGGRDWAVFAYHCGQGCVNEMLELTRRARGIPADRITVPAMFFSASPAWNRELYDAIQRQMRRDFSPTYYFRVMRAQQLLALYRKNPKEFLRLAAAYRSDFISGRAPHRLSVWLRRDDIVFRNESDIRADAGNRLLRAPERPAYFGYALRLAPADPEALDSYSRASASALGTLTYIAFETRRLFESTGAPGTFQPLIVTSMVQPENYAGRPGRPESLAHCSGQVFDIDYSSLPAEEVECLRFVLEDLGWNGYLGFIEEGREQLHVGCSPESRDFFAAVYREAMASLSPDQVKSNKRPGVSQGTHVGELE